MEESVETSAFRQACSSEEYFFWTQIKLVHQLVILSTSIVHIFVGTYFEFSPMQWQKGVSYVLLAEQLSLILFSLMTKVPQISHLPLAGQDLHILPTSLNSIIITELPIHPHPPDVFLPPFTLFVVEKKHFTLYKSP